MILKLARRDPAWTWGVAVIGVYLLLSLVAKSPLPPRPLLVDEMALYAGLITFLHPHCRATLWEAALPIPARQLFLARALSRIAMVWMPMIVCGLLTMILGRTGWSSMIATLECGAILTLALLLPQAVRVEVMLVPGWLVAASWAAVAAAGILGWRLLPAAAAFALFALAGAGVFVRIWMTLPLSFQTAPLEAAGRRKTRLKWPLADARGSVRPALPWWPILRSFQWTGLGFLPMMAMTASFSLFGCFFGVFVMEGSRPRSRWLDSLPLSHRARLLINLVPALVVVVGGMALGLHFASYPYPLVTGSPSTLANGQPGTPDVRVPSEFWKHAGGGAAPIIESPWDETSRPAIVSVFGYRLYNPYSTAPNNSQRFFDWQFGRATEAVYGRSLTRRQLYAATEAELRPITARTRMQILELGAAAQLLLVLIFLREVFRWHRVLRLSRLTRGILMAAALGPTLDAALVLAFMPITRWGGVDMQHLIEGLLIHLSALLPDNLLAVTLAAVLPVVPMYLLLERLFAQTEILGPVRVVKWWSAES